MLILHGIQFSTNSLSSVSVSWKEHIIESIVFIQTDCMIFLCNLDINPTSVVAVETILAQVISCI